MNHTALEMQARRKKNNEGMVVNQVLRDKATKALGIPKTCSNDELLLAGIAHMRTKRGQKEYGITTEMCGNERSPRLYFCSEYGKSCGWSHFATAYDAIVIDIITGLDDYGSLGGYKEVYKNVFLEN